MWCNESWSYKFLHSQSKEQDLKTESENIKDLLQKEKDITAQNSLELEKLTISETSLLELLENKVKGKKMRNMKTECRKGRGEEGSGNENFTWD